MCALVTGVQTCALPISAIERDEAQHMLERALDFSSIATWQLDPRTDALRWHGATAALWGADYESALATGEGFYARVHPGDRDAVRSALQESIATGDPYAMEYRIDHPERGVRWIRSEENTSELQSLMRISYAVFCLKKKT